MGEQKPSIGRIVIYNQLSVDGLKSSRRPAIVLDVAEDGTANLLVLGSKDADNWAEQGNEPGQWNWPSRV